MAKRTVEDSSLTKIANAIRSKRGLSSSTKMTFPDGMVTQIGNISSTDTSNSSSDVTVDGPTVTVKKGYYASDVSKSVDVVTQPNPGIGFDESTGEITASYTPKVGYNIQTERKITYKDAPTTTQPEPDVSFDDVNGIFTASYTPNVGFNISTTKKSATFELPVFIGLSRASTTEDFVINCAGHFCTGNVTIKGDSNLLASNIKKGATIFDVTGTYEGEPLYLGSLYEKQNESTSITISKEHLSKIPDVLIIAKGTNEPNNSEPENSIYDMVYVNGANAPMIITTVSAHNDSYVSDSVTETIQTYARYLENVNDSTSRVTITSGSDGITITANDGLFFDGSYIVAWK